MRNWWVVSVLIVGAAMGIAEGYESPDGLSCKNSIECPAYTLTEEDEKEQYVPVLLDEPPVKDRVVKREIGGGLILEEGREAVIDPEPDFTPTHEEITEESD